MPRGIGGELLWWCPSLDDSGNGTNTLNDLSGNGRNGTLTDMDAATDWVGDTASGGVRALDFDGTNDRVTSATIANQSALTISAWINTSASTRSGIVSIGASGAGAYMDVLATGVLRCAIENNLTSFIFRDSSSVVSGQGWRHVAMTATVSAVNVFVSASNVTTGGSASGTILQIALGTVNAARGFLSPYGGFLSARLDDMRIFGRVLTQAEITNLASRRGYQKPAGSAAVHFFFAGF
jgi:hypothetical protein